MSDADIALKPAPGQFDFGLTAEEEARARRLHETSQVVDMLFQMPGGSRIVRL